MPAVPALYSLKPWYTRRLSGVIRWAVRHQASPDVFTAVGVAGAVLGAAGILTAVEHRLVGVLLAFLGGLVLRLGGANLDGAVARARGVSRPCGFVLNELGDRISDFVLFLGLYLAVPESLRVWVVVAAFVSSLPTLVSVSGAAVGVPRINGSFGKTERCVLFVVAAAVLASSNALAAVLTAFAVLALATTVRRCQRIRRHLTEHGTGWTDEQPTIVEGQ
jgi:CDP-diacylglycerol--glycerol-3-phosphate 3-phosphatidyltransferase